MCYEQLNDVISLAVGLWAVSISKKETTLQYTYGVSFNPTGASGWCSLLSCR